MEDLAKLVEEFRDNVAAQTAALSTGVHGNKYARRYIRAFEKPRPWRTHEERIVKPETIRRLDQLFTTAPVLLGGGPVSPAELDRAEELVGSKFDAAYREFVERYGGAMVGSLPIVGLRVAEVMGDDDLVTDVTAHFRRDGWKPTQEWVVISIDLAGNPIGLDADGKVWLSDHDAGEVVMMAPTFEDFVVLLLNRREA